LTPTPGRSSATAEPTNWSAARPRGAHPVAPAHPWGGLPAPTAPGVAVTTTPTACVRPLAGPDVTTPGGDAAGTCRSEDAVMAGEGAGWAPPVCPDCGADLCWLTGNTLACQRCAYSPGRAR